MTDESTFSDGHDVIAPPSDIRRDDLGHVKKWRRRGDMWEGLVTREADGEVVTAWVPALHLAPTEPA